MARLLPHWVFDLCVWTDGSLLMACDKGLFRDNHTGSEFEMLCNTGAYYGLAVDHVRPCLYVVKGEYKQNIYEKQDIHQKASRLLITMPEKCFKLLFCPSSGHLFAASSHYTKIWRVDPVKQCILQEVQDGFTITMACHPSLPGVILTGGSHRLNRLDPNGRLSQVPIPKTNEKFNDEHFYVYGIREDAKTGDVYIGGFTHTLFRLARDEEQYVALLHHIPIHLLPADLLKLCASYACDLKVYVWCIPVIHFVH